MGQKDQLAAAIERKRQLTNQKVQAASTSPTVLILDSPESAAVAAAKDCQGIRRSRSPSVGGASDDSDVQRRWRIEEALFQQDAELRSDSVGALTEDKTTQPCQKK